jgi:hypothetical protein
VRNQTLLAKKGDAMTEGEWLECADYIPMLIYLRGEVEPPERVPDTRGGLVTRYGKLVPGDATRVSARRLGRFARECCKMWWELPLDETSRDVIVAYERFLEREGSVDEFNSACSRLWDAERAGIKPLLHLDLSGWALNPLGIASFVQTLAWVTACYRHREQIEELERTASEDDRFAWGFFGYEFPEFRATAAAIFRPLPALLREVVGNPFCRSPPLPRDVLT